VIAAAGGASAAFAIDAGTFVVSGLCLLVMAHVPAPAPSGRSVVADARLGIRWTMRQRWLWFTFFGLTYGNLLWGALMQIAVPAHMLGRASSVDWLFSICLSPLGLLFAGALAGSIGVRATVLVGAGLSALSCLVVFVPGVRDPERADYAPVPLPVDVVDVTDGVMD